MLLEMETNRLMEIERKNKEFLDQSWNNMAEDEEAEQRLLKQIEAEPHEEFQVVRRSKGKHLQEKNTC